MLQGRYREFARIANHPGVTLVHDEARSFLTQAPARYDVLQMSLIDTWAATGAGAFTLSENGLYTRDGWQVFLRALTPTGVFSVSRWFDPEAASETTRLLSLGVASLLDFGVAAPRRHLILVTRERIATLMVSPTPFYRRGRRSRCAASPTSSASRSGWPRGPRAADDRLRDIAHRRRPPRTSIARPAIPTSISRRPTDRRPFFFNMLKPRGFFQRQASAERWGRQRQSARDAGRCWRWPCVAAVLVLAIIGWPLLAAGRPSVPPQRVLRPPSPTSRSSAWRSC